MAAQTPLAFEPVHQLRDRMTKGEITPVDIIEGYLNRIARYDAKLHAYIDIYADEARAAAHAAAAAMASGHRIGPFHGIPVAVEDLVEITGRLTTGGCRAWHDRRSSYTATLVEDGCGGDDRAGKTHTVQFAMGGWGTNQQFGTPWNPWDLAVHRTPGGSSAGSGVAVAAGLAPWAIGTDTGGPCRSPPRGVAWSAEDDHRTDQRLRGAPAGSHAGYARPDSTRRRRRGVAVDGPPRCRRAGYSHAGGGGHRPGCVSPAGRARTPRGRHAPTRAGGRCPRHPRALRCLAG